MDGQIIEFQGLEPISVNGFRTFRLVTPQASDDLVIDAPSPGRHRVSGTSDGVSFESLVFFDIATMVVDMAANNGAAGQDQLAFLGGDLSQSGVGAGTGLVPGTASLQVDDGVVNVGAADGLRELRISQPGAVVNILESLHLQSLFIGAGAAQPSFHRATSCCTRRDWKLKVISSLSGRWI